ncbi:MAG: DUF1330 domain-containing protein [Anaerolineales bacterium]|nr:DUF1330 domain-containing protein [Anaerolineales bacterium]
MPCYMIIDSKILDPVPYREYQSRVAEIVAKYGGKYLARTRQVYALSETWRPERLILLEFPNQQKIRKWLASAEYRAIAPLREAGAETKAIIVEGSID